MKKKIEWNWKTQVIFMKILGIKVSLEELSFIMESRGTYADPFW
jgi:hypothetical protein